MPPTSPSREKPLEKVIMGAVLLWVGFVFFRYFSLPMTFDVTFFREVFSHPELIDGKKITANGLVSLRVLFGSFFILFTLWRWGRRMVHGLGIELGNIPLRFSMEMALGILFFNSLWLGLGLNRLWFQPLLAAAALGSGGWALWDFFKNFMKFQKVPHWAWPGWAPLGLACLGLLFLAMSAAQGLLPEIYFDGLVYHLAALRFWEFHHGLSDFYTNLYTHYPMGAELYFFNGFFLQGAETAKMLNVASSALCALAAAGWAIEEAGTASGCFAFALVLFFPWVTSTVWTTQNDVFLAFLFILFYYALFRWTREKGAIPWAFTAGILGGTVLTVKYTAFVGIAAGLLALAVTGRGIFSTKRWMGWGLILSLMLVSMAPWALKNLAYTGNGFYPYFSSWFGGRSISPDKMAALMNDHQAVFSRIFSLSDWLGRIFSRDLDKTIAPVFLSFLPFLFLPGQRRPATKFFLFLGIFLLVGGFLVSHLLRLMLPAFIICFLLFVLTLADLKKREWTYCGAGILFLYGLFSFFLLCRLSCYYHGDQIWLGKKTREEYLMTLPQTASYMDLTQAASQLPESDRLLIAGDSRSLYYPRSFYANSVFDDQVLEGLARRERDGEGVWKALRRMGIEDLVVAGHEGSRLARQYSFYGLNGPEWDKLDDFIQRHTELIYLNGLNGIYRLRAAPVERKNPILNLLNLLKTPADSPEIIQ